MSDVIYIDKLAERLGKTETDILSMKQSFPDRRRVCGVYFLICRNEIVYIGKSRNLLERVVVHEARKYAKCDGFAFIECAENELKEIEKHYINKFKPKHNKIDNPDGRWPYGNK